MVCRTLLGCYLIVHKYSVFSHFYLNFVSVIVNFFLISVESGGTNESLRTGSVSQRIVVLTCKLFGCFLPTTETNLISFVVYVNRQDLQDNSLNQILCDFEFERVHYISIKHALEKCEKHSPSALVSLHFLVFLKIPKCLYVLYNSTMHSARFSFLS